MRQQLVINVKENSKYIGAVLVQVQFACIERLDGRSKSKPETPLVPKRLT